MQVRDRVSCRIKSVRSGAGDMADFDIFKSPEESEDLEQIDHHRNHDNRIQDVFDFAVHRSVGVCEPEKKSNDDQHADDK